MLYAKTPGKAIAQLISDSLVLMWCVGWIIAGKVVYETISLLQGPADAVTNASSGLGDQLEKAGGSLPLGIGNPLKALSGSTESLTRAAVDQSDIINQVAWVMAVVVAAPPILMVLLLAVPVRLRWAHEAGAALRLQSSPNFDELMARRAVVRQPLRKLARVSDDPISDLDNGNFEALSRLERTRLGISAPRTKRLPASSQDSSPPS